ncbi:autotransporter outer membrane beta-barrel domain-containing protein [Achromobacter spanius]|uniref:autotransporter outer membrane beta-barrel domain-containing protein n=1 Tax=Achromobacter spanius TaxID=217203 RepID=UPI003F693D58
MFSVTAVGLILAQPAVAALSCPAVDTNPSNSTTCTISSSQGGAGAQVNVTNTASAGTGDNIGDYGGNYTVINNGAVLQPSAPQGGIFVRLTGGMGSSDTSNNATNGGNGGTITINNNGGTITVQNAPTASGQGSGPGIWADSGSQFGIYGASVGGIGANASDTVIGGGNGGQGGDGSAVTVTNSGNISVSNLPYGGVGIYGASIGVVGGNQDSAATGDQNGGNGGGSNIVNINNSASVSVTGTAGRYAWGIGAESIAGDGGHANGSGSSAGATNYSNPTLITNTGNVSVNVNGSALGSVRGLYILSQGGNGMTSSDGSDNGGTGGQFGAMSVVNSGQVSVASTSTVAPTSLTKASGGIVVIGLGGNGGMGPQTITNTSGEIGGYGGGNGNTTTAVTLNSGSLVTTSGDYLPGVNVITLGGNGGAGREDSNGAAGGNGGTVNIAMNGNASIQTNGVQSHGISAISQGGAGGGVETSSGLIDFTPENAGSGGAGEAVTVTTTGGSIQTRNDDSIGILGQSMGGVGGVTTGNFELFGNAGADAGIGGASGTVTINSQSSISTTGQSSHGISAQAIGGGGGTAGVSSGIIALGGAGGTAVSGGTVNINQSGGLSTSGTGSFGMLGQSIGGGGGDGGAANGVAVIGGQGGGGGNGGSSTVGMNGYTLNTSGDHAYGIVSQSIGGGGGTGGAASSYDAGVGFAIAVAVGGTGGSGGAGGTAVGNVSNASLTTGSSGTTNGDAHGVVVQSIGGGGGAGGASVAKALAIAVPDEDASFGVAVTFAMGGSGATGGAGGTASSAINNSILTTYGANSQGVLVQSIGGGGGLGGSASALSTVVGTGDSVGGTVQSSVGGSGGPGSYGGNATLSLAGSTITTWGDSANALVLQSIGGGGGSGGVGSATGRSPNVDANVSITANVGGIGGAGGQGGTASLTVDPSSTVVTHGDGARAVLVQSIGGGGGSSQGGQVGLAVNSDSEDGSTDVRGTVSVGRGGTGGGYGGTIYLNSDGSVTTHGADADGLLVQSIGGSGGLGGAVGGTSENSASDSLGDSGTTYQFNVSVGGNGGAGGNGGEIGTSSTAASIGASTNTYGDYADAAVLQSIGGGGGAGGASTASSSISSSNVSISVGGSGGSGGAGGSINAFLNGNGFNSFNTSGYGAMGIVMQSIGGGGGMGATGSPLAKGSLRVGATGGSGGAGGNVTVTGGSYASIQTNGDSAHGLVLQSIGGGGGIAMAGSTASAASPGSQQFNLHAGSAGVGGTGGPINASVGLNLNTYGDRAIGVIAQSIGGGGGIVSSGTATGVGTTVLGGGNSNGGSVNLDLQYTLNTHGAGAHGIVAQSIADGGGILGDTTKLITTNSAGFLPSTFNSSSAGSVSVSFNGNLSTVGANSYGIIAQSIGGGGGLAGGPQGGFAGSVSSSAGYASSVTVNQSGTLSAKGSDSTGIMAQSQGGQGEQSVTVNINGSVVGGTNSGKGVWILDGRNNVVNVNAGGSLSALSNTALMFNGDSTTAAGSFLTLNNTGTVSGNVFCGNSDSTSACNIYVQPGGVANAAVAYQANVVNSGLIVIGSPGQFQTLTVSGNFRQADSGVLRADVDFDKMRASRMVVQGNGDLNGKIDVLAAALLPDRELTVLTVQGDSQGSADAMDSPVFDYTTRQVGQDTRIRVSAANFNASAMQLKSNQGQVANHLQRIWDAGGNSALAPLFGQLDQASRVGAGAYQDSVANLSPGVTAAPAVQSAANLGQFTGAMMSCPTFTGVDAFTGEQNCFWGQVTGRTTDQDGSKGTTGFSYDTVTYQFGGQREVSPGWFVGGSAAYENSKVRATNGNVRGDGDSGYVGAVVKREEGQWVFSAAVGGGYGGYRMDRNIDIAGYQDTLTSHPDVYGFNARLRAARTFAYDNMYVKPYLDFDASYTRMPGYQESGSNPLALSVDGSDQFILGLSPMIEFGGRAELPDGAILRPFLYAGVSFLSKNDWTSSARLRGAPAGTGSFDTTLPIDDVVGKVGAGLHVMRAGGVDFRLQYDGQFSEHVRSHSGTLKVMVPF